MNKSHALLALLSIALARPCLADTPPQQFGAFDEVPMCNVHPAGWAAAWLTEQANGLTGHIAAAGYPFETTVWDDDPAKAAKYDWGRYEETAYWVDGALRCGYLSGDKSLTARADKVVQYVLDHPDADGYLGPEKFKKTKKGDPDANLFQWSHVIFFRALMARYSETGDPKILDALTTHYLQGGADYTCVHRDVCNIEILYWLYGKTGNPKLLDMADGLYAKFNKISHDSLTLASMASDNTPHAHGVSFAEMAKLGAVAYLHNGNKDELAASVNGFHKLERDHGMIDGCYSSEEGLAGKGSLAAHETCDIVDYSWSLGYLLMATGDASYGDKIEKADFNAGLGAVLGDFTGLQYFSGPNIVLSDHQSSHTPMLEGNTRMSYRLTHDVQCCTSNIARLWPNYSARAWMKDATGNLVAALYAPGSVELNGLKISEDTNYPFDQTVTFHIDAAPAQASSLKLRIPGWCDHASLTINGTAFDGALSPATFATVQRTFNAGDTLVLTLPMTPMLRRWPEGGASVELGPLVFALRIGQDQHAEKGELLHDDKFPSYAIYATTPWNYALDVDEQSLASAAVIHRVALSPPPWDGQNAPITMTLPAKRVTCWDYWQPDQVTRTVPKGQIVKGPFKFTPPLPDVAKLPSLLSANDETITLVPYGLAKLRVALFPSAKPRFDQALDEHFDGRCPVGWDAAGATLNFNNGKGELTTLHAAGSIKSNELLLDFSKPVQFSIDPSEMKGSYSVEVVEPDGTAHVVVAATDRPTLSRVDLSQSLGWTGPHRFRVVVKLSGAKTASATLNSIQTGYAS